jgi:hypothetical protein
MSVLILNSFITIEHKDGVGANNEQFTIKKSI